MQTDSTWSWFYAIAMLVYLFYFAKKCRKNISFLLYLQHIFLIINTKKQTKIILNHAINPTND